MRFPQVLFDLNGTLVDTFADLTAALGDVLSAHGRGPLDEALVRQWSGERLRSLLRLGFQATGPTPTDLEISELLPAFRDAYDRHLGERAFVYPGVARTLATLASRGVRMSLLTNKPLAPSQHLIELMEIGRFFEQTVAGDGDLARKPDPGCLVQLMHAMGGTRADTLMVGSTRIDLETARNAGVRVALVDHDPSSLTLRGMGADFVLPRFQNLTALVLGQRAGSGVVFAGV